ncbi:CrcB family protein [Halomonas sp. PAMB 3264]|uniref:fluoride efflux transporter FluC n=1 Tax=Halomonas sp. PAMB 3264 TaxID=3075222 RepID=UPI0028971000|nr:CrcB family protein [Halomonas sp. PAMB 3264]WNL43101.1 CrcB family protein [Halomonas sp. PAMB 3264]
MGHGGIQTVINIALLALGAGLGGMGRLAVTRLAARHLATDFPWGTLAVNASGALVAGALLGHYGFAPLSNSPVGLLLIGGLLGGYTTVSSLSLQTLTLWQDRQPRTAIAYLAGTLAAGVALAALGWHLTGGAL